MPRVEKWNSNRHSWRARVVKEGLYGDATVSSRFFFLFFFLFLYTYTSCRRTRPRICIPRGYSRGKVRDFFFVVVNLWLIEFGRWIMRVTVVSRRGQGDVERARFLCRKRQMWICNTRFVVTVCVQLALSKGNEGERVIFGYKILFKIFLDR